MIPIENWIWTMCIIHTIWGSRLSLRQPNGDLKEVISCLKEAIDVQKVWQYHALWLGSFLKWGNPLFFHNFNSFLVLSKKSKRKRQLPNFVPNIIKAFWMDRWQYADEHPIFFSRNRLIGLVDSPLAIRPIFRLLALWITGLSLAYCLFF